MAEAGYFHCFGTANLSLVRVGRCADVVGYIRNFVREDILMEFLTTFNHVKTWIFKQF